MKYKKQFWVDTLGKGWAIHLKEILNSPYGDKLMNFLEIEYAINNIVPKKEDIFKAYKLCPWESLKIVILGDVPQVSSEANGLAFGDSKNTMFRESSLCRLFECIERNYHDGLCLDFDFTLENWAQQGVLLLNRSLTRRVENPTSHKKPWNKFVSATLNAVNEYAPGTIFILWGKQAQALAPHIKKHNYVLTYEQPFSIKESSWNCPNFKEADKILINLYGEKIKW